MSAAEERDEKVEQVARVLCAAKWAPQQVALWDAISEDEKNTYRRMARAAIEAMRELPP